MWQTLIKSFNTAEILLPRILIKLEEIGANWYQFKFIKQKVSSGSTK
jgi:hypothetical protein